jgi:hypothetical protein
MAEKRETSEFENSKVFFDCLKKLHTKFGNQQLSMQTTIKLVRYSMEIVELTEVKGEEQKTLAIALTRKIVVDAPMKDNEKEAVLEMIDNGVIDETIELVVSATRGELTINQVQSCAKKSLPSLSKCFGCQ